MGGVGTMLKGESSLNEFCRFEAVREDETACRVCVDALDSMMMDDVCEMAVAVAGGRCGVCCALLFGWNLSLARVRNFSFEYAESYSIIIISFEVRWRQMTRVPMADHPQDYLVHT